MQNKLAIALVLVASLGLIFQGKIEDWWQHHLLNKDKRPIIGHVEGVTGAVKFREPQSLTTIDVTAGMNLHADDTLLVEEGEKALLTFNSGLKVELEPNSVVVITDTGPEMIFLKGHMKVLNEIPGIALAPEVILPTEAQTAAQTTAQPPEPPTPEGQPTVSRPTKLPAGEHPEHHVAKKINEKISLPDGYISQIIKNQRTFLGRCYAQHLRTDPDSQGRIDTSLTIEADGTVSTARVIGSTIADPQLQQCVVGTLQRAKFRAFAGDPIIVSYPINFD